jgi:hypothetical protein
MTLSMLTHNKMSWYAEYLICCMSFMLSVANKPFLLSVIKVNVILLKNIVMLIAIMLSVIMLNVVSLNVVMLNVVAP